LYHGLREKNWKKYYWLNLVEFCNRFVLPEDQLICVKYFSAEPLNHRSKKRRQSAFFDANLENQRFELYLGRYKTKNLRCGAAGGCRLPYITYEEKQTDINISMHMMYDAMKSNADVLCLISGDSDLAPVVTHIRNETGKQVAVFFPPKRFTNELQQKASLHYNLDHYSGWFRKCLLPREITTRKGDTLKCPSKWDFGHLPPSVI
jgi:uncharacterized LabA/DUF88 family protein